MTKLKKTIMFAPAVFFPAYILVFMFTTRVNVPFWDEWFYIPFVARCLDGHFSFQELAAWHVDHRIIFIHLAYLPTYLAFKGDTLAPLLIQFAAQCLIFAMMLRQASKLFSPGSPWKAAFPAIAAALLFSPQMAGIWLFGASLQQSWASLFYAAAAFSFCVSRPSWPRTAGAVLAALAATTCGANALAVWPVLVAACLFNKAGAWKCATTALLACAVIALYYGATSPAALYSRVFIEGGWTAPGISFSDRFRYIAAFIGSMFSWNSVNGGACWGWIGLAVYAGLALQWLLAGKSRDIRLLAWLALPGLTIASAVMGSYKRIGFAGVFQALDSRYIAMSDVFWVGLFAVMFASIEKWGRGRVFGRTAAAALAAAAGVCYTFTTRPVAEQAAMTNDARFSAQAMRAGYYIYRSPGLVGLCHDPAMPLKYAPWLAENGFHPFRERTTDIIGKNIGELGIPICGEALAAEFTIEKIASNDISFPENSLLKPGIEWSGILGRGGEPAGKIILADAGGNIIADGAFGYDEHEFITVFHIRQAGVKWRAFGPDTPDAPATAYVMRRGARCLEAMSVQAADMR